jgi:ubiquinone/menaquinone biosynthesis C-methylase UbiE
MGWEKTRTEFDAFAETYDGLFNDGTIAPGRTPGDPLWPACRAAIACLQPRSILDCACGPGWQAIHLAQAA